MGVLDGKVVLVTGGANGIGRECAIVAARAGAKVVVNDLGGGPAGGDEGSDHPAEAVAAEIRLANGKAASNSDSVTNRAGVARMIEQARDTFGGLHAVIAPAGILRDTMFHKMSHTDWDVVLDVHLNGTYNVCRAAVNHFREQGEGAFVLFSSTSGLIGNIGQANYAAAKMGIVGLSRILAMEGAQKGIRSNVIAPFAWSRLIATIPIKDEATAKRVEKVKNSTRADQVAQLAIALASNACRDVSGQIFVARGNEIFLMSQPRPVRGVGRLEGWTPETIAAHCMPAMKSSFTAPDSTTSLFSWEPV